MTQFPTRFLLAATLIAASTPIPAAMAQATAQASTPAPRALGDYPSRQTKSGAILILNDIGFAAGRADLSPAAVERLRPLAAWLVVNKRVQVQVDDFTGGGADLSLSDRRASAIRNGLAALGVDRWRIETVGHNGTVPVAVSAKPGVRAQNSRMEITLIGQQVASLTAL
ncbi:MAG: OmpA family protein [Sphingobium sp.]